MGECSGLSEDGWKKGTIGYRPLGDNPSHTHQDIPWPVALQQSRSPFLLVLYNIGKDYENLESGWFQAPKYGDLNWTKSRLKTYLKFPWFLSWQWGTPYSTFCQSEQIFPDDAKGQGFDLLYQSQYHSERRSWYFLLPNRVRKLVAVITEGAYPGEFEWTFTGVCVYPLTTSTNQFPKQLPKQHDQWKPVSRRSIFECQRSEIDRFPSNNPLM